MKHPGPKVTPRLARWAQYNAAMQHDEPGEARPPRPLQGFGTTHWSVVLAAARHGTSESREALRQLCEAYWVPLYSYLRRRGFECDEAEDLTQGFFAKLLETSSLEGATPRRGRFRSYLLGALKHFVSNEMDRRHALKRGGGKALLSLDRDAAEGRYALEPADRRTPEKLFERVWALTVVERALTRLRGEHAVESRKARLFELLKPTLSGERPPEGYRGVARELRMTEGAVKVAAHRFRGRFRELIRDEVAETVSDDAQVEEEIRYLLAAVSG